MDAFVLYALKVILCSGIMFGYYQLFLKDKTFHHYNRFYLLSSVVISIALPLLKISFFTMDVNPKLLFLLQNFQESQPKTYNDGVNFYKILFAGVGLVSIFFLGHLIFGLYKISKIKNSFPFEEMEGIKFYQTNLEEAPFSFFKNLFWKTSIETNSVVGQQILKHEMVHIEQKHTWDKLCMQIVKSVFWINPVFFFISKEMDLIHEYLADHKAVEKSDTKAFAEMLLQNHFSGKTIVATSPFFSSNLKKRLKMLSKNSTKYSYARRILALPVLFILSFVYLVNAKNYEIAQNNVNIDLAVAKVINDTAKIDNGIIMANPVIDAQTKLVETNTQIAKDSKMIADISKNIAIKNSEINKMTKEKVVDTKVFAKKIKEMELLNLQISNIVNSDRYQNLIKSNEEVSKRMADYYNSAEFKQTIINIEKTSQDIEKRAAEIEKVAHAYFYSNENPNPLKNTSGVGFYNVVKFNNNDAKIPVGTVEGREMTAKEKRQYKKHSKELQDQAKEMRDEILVQPNLQNRPWIVTPSASAGKKSVTIITSKGTDANINVKQGEAEQITYFLDGKEISKSDFETINPKNILAINIEKFNKKAEIKITTK